MRRSHLDAFQPVCPRCRQESYQDHPVRLAAVEREEGDHVVEGALHCSNPACLMEYPIIDGIPYLLANLRAFIQENLAHLMARDDLGGVTAARLGDAVGAGTPYDSTRQFLSSYTWDHYADCDPEEPPATVAQPGGAVRCLDAGLSLVSGTPDGLTLDIGCSVGRTTFELAQRRDGLVLGVDLNVPMLRLAARVLRQGRVVYPRRRVGIVYDRRDFGVGFEGSERVDFWAMDATQLPLPQGTVALVSAMNVLDCVSSPLHLLESISNALMERGHGVLVAPYDWSPGATPIEGWIGGHSQRGPTRGATEPLLTMLLTPGAHPQSIAGLRLRAQISELPWHVRLHDRSTMLYQSHVVAVDRVAV